MLRERLSEALAAVNGELEGRFLQEMVVLRTSSTSAKNSPASAMPIWNACAISLKSGPTPDGASTSRFRNDSLPRIATCGNKIQDAQTSRLVVDPQERTGKVPRAVQSRIWNSHVKRTDHQPGSAISWSLPASWGINPASSPMRLREDARTEGRWQDATQGRKPFHHHNRFNTRSFPPSCRTLWSTFHAGG